MIRLWFQIIPHAKQRYETCGDYRRQHGVWCIRVSRMKDKRYCWIVFLHEIIEWAICRLTGVKCKAIDEFDMIYEKWRAAGKEKAPCGCKFWDEPGDDCHAPYHHAHQVATACERLIAEALGVDWMKYNEAVARL